LSRLNRILLVIVIILAAVTAVYWFKPDIITSISALNPFGGDNQEQATAVSPSAQTPNTRSVNTTTQNSTDSVSNAEIDENIEEEEIEEEISPLEKEIMQRHESYQTKVYTYEPYEVPVSRNPFQRIVNSVYLEDEEKEIAEELGSEEAVRRFVQPELPPNSRFTGLISSGDNKLAILEIDDETYIVKENDIILDRYLVKSIMDETVIIDINGYEISLKLGGGEATNEG
jgi:hypothetical protein